MIAMHYRFVLPADYDMRIIKDRIASKGALFDDTPGLIFKAFLYADKHAASAYSADNIYGSFYLWEDSDAMNRFLSSAGFVALCASFGRPEIKAWSVWGHDLHKAIRNAKFASVDVSSLPSHVALAEMQEDEKAQLRKAMDHPSALAAVSAFEPTTWTKVRFHLAKDLPQIEKGSSIQSQYYEVGYVATGPA
jgi:hypothetical protein